VRLVVGLGNPGPEYADTRHNVGFRVVERLAERHGIRLRRERRFAGLFGDGLANGVAVALLEPHTWMNLSGQAVLAAVDALPIGDLASDLVVVYDDLDLPFGRLRVRPGGGAGGHNGLADIQERLGRNDFPRLRFGVGRPLDATDTADWVLQAFAPDEEAALPDLLMRAVQAATAALCDGIEAAMNAWNGDPPPPPPAG